MKTFEIDFTAYVAYETDGYTDKVIGYFTTKSDAESVAKKYGGYGRVSHTAERIHKVYTLFESLEDFEITKNANLVASAKAKLSKEELAALLQSCK